MTSPYDKPVVLTVKEVSDLLRIHRPKVYELIKSGTIEGIKVGADWRIRTSSIEQIVGPIPGDFFGKSANKQQT